MTAVPINPARLEKLKDLGLTEYQARAYLALLDLGVAPAKDVASLSRVPKSKIYSTLDQLHDKGLLRVVPEHPKRYQVLNIETYLREISTDFQSRLAFIHDRRDELLQEFNPRGNVSLEERGAFTVLKGRRNLETKVQEMVAAAKDHLLILGTENTPRRLVHIRDELASAAARGVSLVLHVPRTPGNAEALERLSPHVSHQDSLAAGALASGSGVTFYLVDGREAMLAHYIPDDAHFYQGDDVAVWTDDGSISRALEALTLVRRRSLTPASADLPERVARALRERGEEPVVLVRALAETLAHHAQTPPPDLLREQGRAIGGLLRARLPAPHDPEARLDAAARLFRDAGLAAVALEREGDTLNAVLHPDGPGTLPASWHALLAGTLEGVAGGPDTLHVTASPGPSHAEGPGPEALLARDA